jgi:ATP-dependent protease HslVU (ClpYQ) peptidase subunit
MTTIIGVQYKDHCIIAADNLVTADNGRKYTDPRMEKISSRGPYLIAGSGEVQPCDIAQRIWQPPRPSVKDKQDIYNFMITKVMPSLRECLKANGYNFEEERKDQGFHFLIALNGQIFDVEDDCSVVVSSNGIYGVGSGSEFAMGALHAGAEPLKALEIASDLSAYTSGPFLIKKQDRS